jgi:hypothetical protein
MFDWVSYLGLLLMIVGFFWGLLLAFQRNILTGFLTLVIFPVGIVYFLLFIRPPTFQRPLSLLFIGLLLLFIGSALNSAL